MFIETDRLILKPLAASDLDAQHALWSQEPVYRHITGKPMDRETVWLRLLRDIGHWQIFGFGTWSVRLKDKDQHIGVMGIFDFKREIDPPLDALETGWVFDSAFHGQGYASEALKAALLHTDNVLNLTKTQCIIAPENAASLKLALRHGYKPLRETLFHDEPTFILERIISTD
ncbi:GNAT family N-acetyltransferase [Asticcacaulis sp.]|uniref:GNAT family N-acetyltransferase n=1 Tax=Asticcacaulis sp. TaxID=1872648 RepID=UPI003F7B365C